MTAPRETAVERVHRFADAMEAFGRSLSPRIRWKIKRDDDSFWFYVEPPTKSHRKLTVTATPDEIDYTLGKIWTEQLEPLPDVIDEVLAHCDAVRDGRVREVRDRWTGLLYHVYRLKTRGQYRFSQDSQYDFRHWFRIPVRKVKIHRLPPLAKAA